jgi:hypothetical protein
MPEIGQEPKRSAVSCSYVRKIGFQEMITPASGRVGFTDPNEQMSG